MEKTKKNNKGFSLVELIVVVLIMAVIAVAMAPQVMKWVDRSRLATDRNSYDALVSTVQLAMVDGIPSADVTITMEDDKTTCDNTAFAAQMTKVAPDWESTYSKTVDTYTLKITKDTGALDKSGGPDEVETD